MDRDFKAIVPEAKRLSYAPARDPAESAEAYLRTLRDQVGDPTLDLYTPGSRCMLAAYPYAPFEQLERLVRMEDSKPLRVSVRGDRAVADSDRPAHGFVPILLERRQGLWRVDHVETWKNLFFDSNGDYRQHNSNHPYAFALSRFGDARLHGVAPYGLDPSDLVAAQRALAARGDALGEYLLGELLFRNCWLPVEALAHYERAIERSPHNLLFHETLGDRASYIGFHDLAVSAYAELGAYGLLPLARAQQAAGKVEEATATAREAVERDPYSIEALELLHWLLVASEDRAGAERVEQRLAKIRSDPDRPDAAVTIAFDPPYPVLHSDRPVRVGDTDVYDYSVFGLTLANPSAREIEVESVTLEADGTAGRSGRKDFKDYWKYPAGDHRLRPGESVSFNKSWGYDYEIDQHQIRYVFDVCWKGDGDRQCHAYWVDLLPAPVLLAGLADPVRADKTLVTAERIERVKDHSPRLAARLELLALLRAREFAELTRRVEAEQAAFERDPSLEPIAAQLWDTFATSDPTLQSVLEDWSESVASYAPRAALGVYHRRCGWAARGARLASKTSREQFDAMSEHFARSKQHLLRALEMHPQLVIAVQNLISSGRAGSDDAEMRRLVDRAMGICPSCVGPLASYLESLEPRWGGSHEQMERFLAELAPRMREHPRLAALRGTVAANRAFTASNREEYAAALRLYDEALGHGEHWPFRRYRGQVLYRLGRYDEALADHEAWLANGTRSAEALMWKAYTLGKLKRTAEAAESIALARLLDPGDDEIARLASRYDGSR
jgi:tetratricopeptide (TPR) repeat protein